MAKQITFGGHSRAAILRGVNKLADTVKNSNIGYNVLTEKFEDLIAAGVIDPAKVTRSALQNAASIAGLMLTTEVLISELPVSTKT